MHGSFGLFVHDPWPSWSEIGVPESIPAISGIRFVVKTLDYIFIILKLVFVVRASILMRFGTVGDPFIYLEFFGSV